MDLPHSEQPRWARGCDLRPWPPGGAQPGLAPGLLPASRALPSPLAAPRGWHPRCQQGCGRLAADSLGQGHGRVVAGPQNTGSHSRRELAPAWKPKSQTGGGGGSEAGRHGKGARQRPAADRGACPAGKRASGPRRPQVNRSTRSRPGYRERWKTHYVTQPISEARVQTNK